MWDLWTESPYSRLDHWSGAIRSPPTDGILIIIYFTFQKISPTFYFILFSVLCSKLLHQNRIRIYDTGILYCLLFSKYIFLVFSASPSVAICTICVSCSRLRFSYVRNSSLSCISDESPSRFVTCNIIVSVPFPVSDQDKI
jgi:hypothetical protein